MTHMYIMRGVPGSGKSTWANWFVQTWGGFTIVSRDIIRAELTGSDQKMRGDNAFENKVTKVQNDRIRDLLMARKSVIVDNTNTNYRSAQGLANMANDYGATFATVDLNVSLETALTRNARRENRVPDEVVRDFHKKANWSPVVASSTHPFVDWTPVEQVTSKVARTGRIAYIFDIDGTLALNNTGLSPYDPAHYATDDLNLPVAHMYDLLRFGGFDLFILSGRDSKHREVTEKWLRGNALDDYLGLYMRAEGDTRRDDTIKVELFNTHLRGRFEDFVVFDDRDRVVKAWRTLGIPCFQVADGNF